MSFLSDLAGTVDNVGTALNLPGIGLSEFINGGRPTANTGRINESGLNNVIAGQGIVGQPLGIGMGTSSPYYASNGSQPTAADLNGSGTGSGTSTLASAPNYAAMNAGTINQLQQGADTINSSLSRLPGQLGIAEGNIGTQYGQKNNELDSGLAQTQNSYNQSTTQNQQGLRTNKNVINDQASNGLRGLMRMLGSFGATGSDMGLAGQAVSNQQSQQNAGAGQTYSQNQSGLDTNFGTYKNQFDNQKKQLNDWKSSQINNAESQSLTTKQDLLSKLADIQGQIAAARGGSYSGSAQPYLDQANTLSGQIDNLGKLNPTYSGTTPVYQAPTLGSYNPGNGTTIGTGDNGTGAGLNTPFLNLLLGKEDKTKLPVVPAA